MKTDKPSYPSQKILGKLYRECKNFQQSMNFHPPRRTGHVDPRFLAQGFEEYVESARETLAEYTEHIENVLNLYGIQTEEELMSGCFYKLQKKLGRERQQVGSLIFNRLCTKILKARVSDAEERQRPRKHFESGGLWPKGALLYMTKIKRFHVVHEPNENFLKYGVSYNVGNGLYWVFTATKRALSFQQKRTFI